VRVISGIAKGRRLKDVPGTGTRPVTDRVKEAVFDILGSDVEGRRFLDLFAGTGGIGIEALSRGAAEAWFVEKEPRALATIKGNLQATGLAEAARVVRDDVFRFVRATPEQFDIVYVAPPQYKGLWKRALLLLDEERSAAADLVIVQIHPKEFESLPLRYFDLDDERTYGSTLVAFYRRVPAAETPSAPEGDAVPE
jgi:16S rRNA (guanine966-N2)-methyltransferase